MPKTIFTGANLVVVEALKAERLKAGLKQSELAERIGKDQSWISLVEGSQRRVDVVEFIQLAEALDVDPTALLGEIVARL
ncbi:helix-turn-helix domain-containing protein [Rhizorhabdus wittichii]